MKRATAIICVSIALLAVIAWQWPRITHRGGDMRDPRSEIHAAVIGRDIYVVGGIGFFRTLSSCERYDTVARRWHRCPDLPRALHHVALASDGQRIYASGGYIGLPFRQDQNPALFAYAPGDERWTEIAALPQPIGQHAMIWRQGMLYLVGGQSGGRDLAALWAYDLESSTWSEKAPMPTARHSHAIAMTNGLLFVAGGRSAALGTEIDRVEAYDFSADSWQSLPAMPVGRGGHGAFATRHALHIVGGENLSSGTVFDRHDIFDLERMEWRDGQPLSAPRHGLATAIAGKRAYALGGGSRAGTRTIFSVTGSVFSIDADR